jgi:hypothetical protein
MAGATHSDKRKSFVVARTKDGGVTVTITSRNPKYNPEQAVKDLAEIDALISEGKFRRLKTAKRPGRKTYLYKFTLSDGRRFRHGTNVRLKRRAPKA